MNTWLIVAIAGMVAWIPSIALRIIAIVISVPIIIAIICFCVGMCGGSSSEKPFGFGHPDWSSSDGWGGGDC